MDRLKELKAKKELTDEEKKELAELEAKASETEDEEIEISESVMKELKDTVTSAVKEQVAEAVKSAIESNENVIRKDIGGGGGKSTVTYGAGAEEKEIEEMSKEVRLVKGIQAMLRGDMSSVSKFNKFARAKAGYQNETTDADGAYLVPDPDFIAEVARLEEQYGVAARNARILNVRSDSVKMNKKSTGVTMYETGEGVAKTGTKMTFGQDTVVLRKFAGIASVTDELSEDAAVNIFDELAKDFARESARIEDVLVFTDSSSGIIRTSGTAAVTVGAAITSIDFDDLNTAVHSVPTDSMAGGKFYLHRTILGLIQRIKDSQNNYIWQPGVNGTVDGTIWGFPYVLTEVLPSISHVGDANEPYIVFGNLQYTTLIRKSGLQLATLKEATVHDSLGNAVNLAEQDMTGLRAVIRRANKVQFPEAFCLIGTGTVS